TSVLIRIQPIENRIGDVFGHVWQHHEDVMALLAATVQLHQGVEIDLTTFVGNAEAVRLSLGWDIIRTKRRNDAEMALHTGIATLLNRYALELLVRVGVAVERVRKGVRIAQDRRGIID